MATAPRTPPDRRPAAKKATPARARRSTPAEIAATTAARREDATGVPAKAIVFEHDKITYTIDMRRADDVELLELAEDGKDLTAIRRLLGDQWDVYKDAHRDDDGIVSATGANEFLEVLYRAVAAVKN